MTQGDLAAAAGVGRATVARLETDSVTQPHMGTITALATALDVTPTDLVGDPAAIWAGERSRRPDPRLGTS
jgi:transcriptional regulator with XRE-family HTH domain